LPASELLEWAEYWGMEPFGAFRDNYHAAMIAHLLANAHRAPNSPPIEFSQFMFRDQVEEQRKADDLMIMFMEAKVRDGN